MKNKLQYYILILWFIAVVIFAMIFVGCENSNKIEPGDRIEKCVIDSFEVKQPVSVAEFEQSYIYYTNCGTRIISRSSGAYKIGDTITYVYKKNKK